MKTSEFLQEVDEHIEGLVNRLKKAVDDLNDDQLNWSPEKGRWSIGQILEHLALSNRHYITLTSYALGNANEHKADPELRHTKVGSLLIKAAGPGTNTPVPMPFKPDEKHYHHDIVERVIREHEIFRKYIAKSKGRDICSLTFGNPLMPAAKMNVADAYRLVDVHGDRHVRQIEEVRNMPGFPN